MDDEDGIELSLGLSFGGSAGKSKAKDGCSDNKTEEGGSSKLVCGNLNVADVSLKHFFHASFEKQESSGQQRSEPGTQHHENFWTDLGKSFGQEGHASSDMHGSGSQFTRFQELWAAGNKSTGNSEEKQDQLEIGGKLWPDASNKRKLSFDDIQQLKKQEREVDHANAHGKSHTGLSPVKNSHVSVTSKDGSYAVNEDVAESEVEGSTSRLVSQHDDNKQYMGSSSDVAKDKRAINDSRVTDAEGNAAGNQSSLELGSMGSGVPLSLQAQPVKPVSYPLPVKVPTATTTTSNSSGFPSVMQLIPPTSSDQPMIHSMNSNSLQLTFGYSAGQLPTLDTGSTWALASHPQQFCAYVSKAPGDGVQNADLSKDDLKLLQATVQAPQHTPEDVGTCSSQKDNETKGNIFKPKEISDQSSVEGFPEGLAIRPGIAPGVKFGGCGSYPDLPWVSTTGPGPNGKTISGVTYRCGQNQIKIVCACHGSHMSPEEFVQHASADAPSPENGTVLASYPSSNPAASAQS